MTKNKEEPAGIGDNHPPDESSLRIFCERIERLVEEKKGILDDIKDVKAEAKSQGFDVKLLGEMLKARKDPAAYREARVNLDVYLDALGLL